MAYDAFLKIEGIEGEVLSHPGRRREQMVGDAGLHRGGNLDEIGLSAINYLLIDTGYPARTRHHR